MISKWDNSVIAKILLEIIYEHLILTSKSDMYICVVNNSLLLIQ